MGLRMLAACFVIGSSLIASPSGAAEKPAMNLRYSLTPGREFSYRTEAVSKRGDGTVYLVDWKVWTIGRESDGSWRLVIRCDLNRKRSAKPKPGENEPVDTLVWRCRMFDDGRLVGATTMGTVRDPYRIFPRLPDGPLELERGWDSAGSEEEGVALHHRLSPASRADGDFLSISTKAEGPEDRVYLSRHSMHATFDRKRGAVTRVETEDASEHLSPGAVTRAVIELISFEDRGAEWAANLGREADRYFDAVEAYEEFEKHASRDAARCKELLAKGQARLEKAREGILTPVFLDAIGQKLAEHERTVEYRSKQAMDHAGRVGKPAEGWEAKDLDGKSHRLADYRGKVVVMDFWYRNCGWCIHAMPQVAKLSEAFLHEDVAVLGMCIDEKESDARAVIEAIGLKYPTIKAAGIPEKYGVQGYPTLIVVDKTGTVREIHVGYSPRLFEELSGVIRGLLGEKDEAVGR
jgi:peroxiredoxin